MKSKLNASQAANKNRATSTAPVKMTAAEIKAFKWFMNDAKRIKNYIESTNKKYQKFFKTLEVSAVKNKYFTKEAIAGGLSINKDTFTYMPKSALSFDMNSLPPEIRNIVAKLRGTPGVSDVSVKTVKTVKNNTTAAAIKKLNAKKKVTTTKNATR